MDERKLGIAEEFAVRGFKAPGGSARTTTGIRLDAGQDARLETVRLALEKQYGGYLSKSAAVRHVLDMGLKTFEARIRSGAGVSQEDAHFVLSEVNALGGAKLTILATRKMIEATPESRNDALTGAYVAVEMPSDDLAPEYHRGDIVALELSGEPHQRDRVLVAFDGQILAREWIMTPTGIILLSLDRDVLPIPVPRPMDVRVAVGVAGRLGRVLQRVESKV